MKRVVTPEWLDEMGPEEKAAMRSRQDLQRLNSLLAHASWIAGPLLAELRASGPRVRIVDLGAGDGTFAWRLVRRITARAGKFRGPEESLPLQPLHPSHSSHKLGGPNESLPIQHPQARIVLVDQRLSVPPEIAKLYESAGWTVEVVPANVLDWLPGAERADAIVANLFLHHFDAVPLARLLALAAGKCGLFVACEPRRSVPALAASRLLWLIGCNAVTRHDAVISVRAGFTGRELSSLWTAEGWTLREERAGLFSHLFVAKKNATAK